MAVDRNVLVVSGCSGSDSFCIVGYGESDDQSSVD